MASKQNNEEKPVIGLSIDRSSSQAAEPRALSPTAQLGDEAAASYELSSAQIAKQDTLSADSTHSTTDLPNAHSSQPPTIYIDPSNPNNPRSAFYAHRSTRTDKDQALAESQSRLSLQNPSNAASQESFHGSKPSLSQPVTQTTSQQSNHKHSRTISGKLRGTSVVITDLERNSVWPSRRELEEKALLAKRHRLRKSVVGRQWSKLDSRQKFWTKVGIALFLLAAAVGIGVGITVSVRGTYYAGDGQYRPIPNPNPDAGT